MVSTEKFCLRWNDFESNISGAFRELREDKDFFDVTLACDDEQLQAHKVILSACSPFFRTILRRNKHEHPLLYLKGVKYVDLVSVLNFMYHGEVNVAQEELNSFLAVAEDLKVKGLTQNNSTNALPTSQANSIKPRIDIPDKKEPPPKRPKPPPSMVPRAPPANFHQDEDIQEVLPVKTEPVTLPPETTPHSMEHDFSMPQVDQMATGVVADPNMEYGEEYADYESYEVADGGFDNSGMIVGQDGNKDVENLVKSFMKKTTDEFNATVWQCVQCGKVSKVSTNLKDHIEANHIEGLQFECHHCLKIFKTRPSLRTHMRLHNKHANN